jgi:DNA helicase-2/ATP-dependent DNA helicase PcrA
MNGKSIDEIDMNDRNMDDKNMDDKNIADINIITDTDFTQRYIKARRDFIEASFSHLNPVQREAVLATEGPLLLLAGAGSGKTSVLINRIENLIRFGKGSDSDYVPYGATESDIELFQKAMNSSANVIGGDAIGGDAIGGDGNSVDAVGVDAVGVDVIGVDVIGGDGVGANSIDEESDLYIKAAALAVVEPVEPWRIIAITFTNKAADELKSRLGKTLGNDSLDIWAMTFHAACVRILRRDIEQLGYDSSFTIYDTADSASLMKRILKEMEIEERNFPHKTVLGYISKAKDGMISATEFLTSAESTFDSRRKTIGP